MKNIKILVTGIGGGGVGEQIIKCLKMSQRNYRIFGGDMNRYSKGFMSVEKGFVLPPAKQSDNYIEAILHVCNKNDIQVLFYGSEPELKVMSDYRDTLYQNGIFVPLNPKRVIDLCLDKNKTMEWLKTNGFYTPKSICIKSIDDLTQIDFIPAVLKPSKGSGGSVNTFIAQNKEEIEMFGNYLLRLYGEYIAQEYIGRYDEEYTVGIFNDMDGNYLNSIAVKKNILTGLSNKIKLPNRTEKKQHGDFLVISSGVSQGEIGKFPEVTEECRKIAKKLRCTGPINIQCRFADDKVYVFEINPRISGTASLRAMVGYNEPDMLIRKHILDEEIDMEFKYNSGLIARGLEEVLLLDDVLNHVEEVE